MSTSRLRNLMRISAHHNDKQVRFIIDVVSSCQAQSKRAVRINSRAQNQMRCEKFNHFCAFYYREDFIYLKWRSAHATHVNGVHRKCFIFSIKSDNSPKRLLFEMHYENSLSFESIYFILIFYHFPFDGCMCA